MTNFWNLSAIVIAAIVGVAFWSSTESTLLILQPVFVLTMAIFSLEFLVGRFRNGEKQLPLKWIIAALGTNICALVREVQEPKSDIAMISLYSLACAVMVVCAVLMPVKSKRHAIK